MRSKELVFPYLVAGIVLLEPISGRLVLIGTPAENHRDFATVVRCIRTEVILAANGARKVGTNVSESVAVVLVIW